MKPALARGCGGRRNKHHIAARSRWRGARFARTVVLPIPWHNSWHALVWTMTPYEACFFLEEVLLTRTRKGWTWPMICRRREQIIARVEELRKRRFIDPLARYETRRDGPVSFGHLPGTYAEMHTELFGGLASDGGLATVAEVHTFVREIMVPGKKFSAQQLHELHQDVRRRRGIGLVR